jgi:hypothetical protein
LAVADLEISNEFGFTSQTDPEYVLEELNTTAPEVLQEYLNSAKKKVELKEIVNKYESEKIKFNDSFVG